MLQWIAKLFSGRAPRTTASGTAPPAQAPRPPEASVSERAGRATKPARSRAKPAAARRAPSVGATAVLVAPCRLARVKVLAVRSGGRRVLIEAPGLRLVQLFARLPDQTYRLAGASGRGAPRLLFE